MPPHTESFAPEPDWHEAVTGDELDGPGLPLVVKHDGPIDVRQYPARSFTTGQFPTAADGTPQRIAGYQPTRSALLITNTGAATAYISADQQSATPTTGYPLAAGATLSLVTSNEVWACTVAAAPTTLAALAQRHDG